MRRQSESERAKQAHVLLWFAGAEEEKLVSAYLTKSGIACVAARNRDEFENLAAAAPLVVIDLSVKETDAILLCHELKQQYAPNPPFVIIVADKPEDYTHVTALDLGADDYIVKPIKPQLLLKRILALARRKGIELQAHKELTKNFYIDTETRLVYLDGKVYEFPKMEFELLRLLSAGAKKVFSREEIASILWEDESVAHQRTIDVHVWNIRKVLGKSIIYTVKGLGYGFRKP